MPKTTKGNTQHRWDSAGNLTDIVYPSSTAIAMKYDADNRLTNMVDAVGTTSFTYTDWGALLTEDGPWDNDTITYSYTTNRLRSKLSLLQPNNSPWEQTYAYDSANRLTNATSPAGAFGYIYDSTANLKVGKLSLPNGAYITNTYDTLSRMSGTYLKNSSEATLNSHEYTYDNAGRRTRQTRTGGDYVDYSYDNIGQLKTAIGKESGGITNRMHEQFGYAYDTAWNLSYRTNNALVEPFSVDSLNQLSTITRSGAQTVAGTSWGPATNVTVADNGNAAMAALRYADNTFARTNVTLLNGTNTFTAVGQDGYGRVDTNKVTANLPSTVNYAYDGNGNMLTNGTRFLDYDDENELIRMTEPNVWKSEFTYDGKMRRRIRREYLWQLGAWRLTSEVHYVYDGNLVLQERDANNLPALGYTHGNDLSGSFEGAGGIGGLLAFSQLSSPTAQHAYYHADGNGNVTMLVSSIQVVAAKYIYHPFGNTTMAGPLASANWLRFSSKEAHPASGVLYYLYRYYDPNTQRWTTRDPIGERGGLNLFSFVGNDPLISIDAFGLDDRQCVWPACKQCTCRMPDDCDNCCFDYAQSWRELKDCRAACPKVG